MNRKERTTGLDVIVLQNKKPKIQPDTIPKTDPSPVPDSSQNGVPGSSSHVKKRPKFTSYTDVPNLSPKIKLICEILANDSPSAVESALDGTGITITPEDVEEVLKLSYGSPAVAVKFFRWAGWKLGNKCRPHAWNLMVDLLGKNSLFDAMSDVVQSMRQEGLLSLATFASIFSSYVRADNVGEAIKNFLVIDQHGIPKDVLALNSLLSAICRDGPTLKAQEFLDQVKDRIRPDSDTFAILLEGWEKENNAVMAKKTFGDMVVYVGWDRANVPAYDAFLNTAIKGLGLDEAMKILKVMKDKKCFPGMQFYRNAIETSFKQSNARDAWILWGAMIEQGCMPDTSMFNSMIGLFFYVNQMDTAFRFYDEMVFHGAFPDSETYNVMIQFLLKNKKLREASALFNEMVKNECIASQATCASAIKAYLDSEDPDMALQVWKHMAENDITPNEDIANNLLFDLRFVRLPEALKCAEDMIDRGIKISSSTMTKLKGALTSVNKGDLFDSLQMRWKKSH